MPRQSTPSAVATIGIDLGKNTFHLVGFGTSGAQSLCSGRYPVSQLELRLSNVPALPDRHGGLLGLPSHRPPAVSPLWATTCVLLPAQYVKPFLKGHKNDYRDAEAIAEAVQRPTMRFRGDQNTGSKWICWLCIVSARRLVGQRTGTINQIRGFLIERGIIVRQGVVPLRKALPDILGSNQPTYSRQGW